MEIETSHHIEHVEDEKHIQVTLKNPSDQLAFFIEMHLVGENTGQSVLPIFWEDNYISLMPGETKNILGVFSENDLNGDTPALKISGWNLE